MDMQMYNLVKAALKDGKSIEDVVAEVNAMGKAAEEDLKPKTPIKDKYSYIPSNYAGVKNLDGTINRTALISAIAFYFVQRDFEPDECFDNEADFRDHIGSILDGMLRGSKRAMELAKMKRDGVSDDTIAFKTLGDILDELFRGFKD